jgi:Holliday junction resolvase RusA-like endonuclease
MIIYIPFQFTTLNKYINAERTNKYIGAKIKREETEIARLYFIGKTFTSPLEIKFKWYVKDMRTDPDNICFSKKMILDGMVKAKFIPNDNLKHIKGFQDVFIVNKNKVGVEVECIEVKSLL